MKNATFPKLIVKCFIIVLTALVLIGLPAMLHLFNVALSGKVDTAQTVLNRDEMINAAITAFFTWYWQMTAILAVVNLVFLVVEDLVPNFHKGSYGRFFAQAALNVLVFIVFSVLVMTVYPDLAQRNGLVLFDGASGIMWGSMLVSFLVMGFISLYVCNPFNRYGMTGAHLVKL